LLDSGIRNEFASKLLSTAAAKTPAQQNAMNAPLITKDTESQPLALPQPAGEAISGQLCVRQAAPTSTSTSAAT